MILFHLRAKNIRKEECIMLTTEAPEIRADYSTGLYTIAALAKKYGCHRDTIRAVLKRSEDKDVYIRTSNPKNPLILPYVDFIRDLLQKGDPSVTSIHRAIRNKGANISYSTVKSAVKRIKRELDFDTIRYETKPGQQGQADWAEFPGFSVTIDGKELELYAFFLILGYSRMRYVEFVTEMKTSTLIQCIEHAFQYFNGSPREMLFDNMPQVVNRCINPKKPGKTERELVPEFTAFADYYDFQITLARIRRPQEKGKVERFVEYFKGDFMPMLDRKTGHDLAELNRKAILWCDTVNNDVHQTTEEIPYKRLPNEGLNALPEIPYYEYRTVTVTRDGCVFYRGQVYHVDESLAGCEGEIIDLENTIFALIDGQYYILGRRKLPVYIRKSYSKTKQEIIQHKRKKQKKTDDFRRWLPEQREILIDWRKVINEHCSNV